VTFTPPSVDYRLDAPMLIVFGVAARACSSRPSRPRRLRFSLQFGIALAGLVAARRRRAARRRDDRRGSPPAPAAAARVVIDGPALFLQGTILVLAAVAVLTHVGALGRPRWRVHAAGRRRPRLAGRGQARRAGLVQSEVFPLLMFSVGGMLLFPAANDLLTMFVALEVLSLPLYLMCGLARRRRLLSQEASLKYFLLGAFSSAFFLYGAALMYGYAGSVRLPDIANAISGTSGSVVLGREPLLLLGLALLVVGLLFKVGAAPFHVWTPDVYQGAPTSVTGFMAACTKVAAFGALLRVAYVAIPDARWDWSPVLWGVAIVTMVVGSVIAIVQSDVKRMLAYSSIAHAGFILTGILAMDKTGVSGVLFYLFAYGFATIGAFALVTLVRDAGEQGTVGGEATHLSQWAGLGRRHPVVAAVFSLFLLAFAGIPATSGFIGKFAVFSAAVAHGAWVLALVGVLASAVAAFFYVRVLVLMYFTEPTGSSTVVALPGWATSTAIAVCATVTVVLGVMPSVLLDPAAGASVFLR
jgi:NADH-quinone oxidoreductase subunit N